MSVHGDEEFAFVKELLRVLLRVRRDHSHLGGSRRLAIGSLRPREGRRDAVHVTQHIVKDEVAIRYRAVGTGEIDAVVRCSIDGDVAERDVG